MQIGLIGINEEEALPLREEVAKACRRLKDLPFSFVVLCTCVRVEIYFSSPNMDTAANVILDALKKVLPSQCQPLFGRECFLHLALVTSGLKSALIGETDVQRQVKLAYLEASSKRMLSSSLHFLFQKSLKIGKEVRNHFALQLQHGSLAKVIYEQMKRHTPILFVGFSQTNRKILSYFQQKGITNLTLVTRHLQSAEPFCRRYQIALKGEAELETANHYRGIVIATHVERPLFSKELKNQIVCDLSVPRCVDPTQQMNLLDIDGIMQLVRCKQTGIAKTKAQIDAYTAVAVEKQFTIYNNKLKWLIVCA